MADALELFGIAGNDGELRAILQRLVCAGAVSVGELQTARDIIGRGSGVPDSAYLFIAAMFVSLHSGDVSMELTGDDETDAERLVARAGRFDRRSEERFSDDIEFSRQVASRWPDAVSAARRLEGDVLICVKSEESMAEEWYFQLHHAAILRVEELVAKRLSRTAPPLPPLALERAMSYSRGGFRLGDDQRKAVAAAVAHPFSVITGGPGTGKTTIVCSIIRALIHAEGLTKDDIALAAPTGRAAQRMGEALRAQCAAADDEEIAPGERAVLEALDGVTIHSLLGGFAPHWRHDAANPVAKKLVVIDEFSMVGLLLMRALMEALPDGCRIVLLGDRNQLPPVEAGAVLGGLRRIGEAANAASAFVELVVSRRFRGSLRECVDGFRRGDPSALFSESSRIATDLRKFFADGSTIDTCTWHEPAHANAHGRVAAAEIEAFLLNWAECHGLAPGGALEIAASAIQPGNKAFHGEMTQEAATLFSVLAASRILSVVRNGPFGSNSANALLLRRRDPVSVPGIPIMITANTPALGLFNGDVGVTAAGAEGAVFVLFPRGGKVVVCRASSLPEHEVAFAMTVHKSQGSEFDDVLLVLPDDPQHPLLSRRLVYTGITRSKKRSVVFGTRQAIEACFQRF